MNIKNLQARLAAVNWWPWLIGLGVLVILGLLWQPIAWLAGNPDTLRGWVEASGPFGPLAFFLLNVAQIVVAPIPGYPVQVLGGLLFGVVAGSIYVVGGMVAGGTLAAWLGRRYGRPWLEGRLGAETLEYWSDLLHINSFWAWWIILLIPLGDVPYFLAGLTRIRLSMFALAILVSRGPFSVLIVWFGYNATNLPLLWLAVAMAAIVLVVAVGYTYRHRLEAWGRMVINRYLRES